MHAGEHLAVHCQVDDSYVSALVDMEMKLTRARYHRMI
jgi:hypothetical protein